MPFWSDPQTSPKRVHRWLLHIDDLPVWVIKTAKRPTYEITTAEHQYLVHTFKFPGRIKWKEIEFSVVDVVNPDSTRIIMDKLRNSGYHFPTSEFDYRTITKAQAVAALGSPILDLIDANGQPIERWTFTNAFLTNQDSDDLKYDGDELLSMTMTMHFDFAELADIEEVQAGDIFG